MVLPSIEEGFGLVCTEAIGSGCVPLVSDACTDLCRHMENSLVHPVGDVDELARQIDMLHSDRSLLARLRAGCLATAPEVTWTVAGEQLLARIAASSTLARNPGRALRASPRSSASSPPAFARLTHTSGEGAMVPAAKSVGRFRRPAAYEASWPSPTPHQDGCRPPSPFRRSLRSSTPISPPGRALRFRSEPSSLPRSPRAGRTPSCWSQRSRRPQASSTAASGDAAAQRLRSQRPPLSEGSPAPW